MNRGEIKSYGNLELLAKNLVQGFITGLHKSPFRGFSVEFAEHRQYNNGESTKHIDWKLFGRTDRLFIKEFEEETNLRAHFIVDASPSMYYPLGDEVKLSKFEFACYASAVLMEMLQKQRDAFGLCLFDDRIRFDSEIKSTSAHKNYLFNILEEEIRITPPKTGASNLIDVLHTKAESLPKRSLVVVFTDFLQNKAQNEELWEAFRHLSHNQHDIIVYHIRDNATERDLDFGNRQVKMVDAESGEELKLNPEKLKMAYKEKMEAYFKEINSELLQMRVDLCVVDIQEDMDKVLRAYLSRRKKKIQSKRF